ncbi:hypothetical protein BKP35_08940 [Anaerobacillus arseniciselenatis]|uniref:Uncharacterized protein n=1 Tax=Anaerobacillus arseniciselenatis TaxID=85682 RepID=A0A1S2LLX3_9BACI|nr:hypothetical protein [Anaerobacillus arseniciselenatis]OIJ13528.1 hypothetical protein BKP35_08940 [Anaerobacillus arseniciselenatis]
MPQKRKVDHLFLASAIFVIDNLSNIEEFQDQYFDLYEIKKRSILYLEEKNITNKLGLYKSTRY